MISKRFDIVEPRLFLVNGNYYDWISSKFEDWGMMVDVYLEMLMNSVHSVQTQRQYTRTFVMFLKFTGLKNTCILVPLVFY